MQQFLQSFPDMHVNTPYLIQFGRWLGKLGIRGIVDGEHYFVLTTNDDGTTRLHHGERFSEVLVALAKGSSGQGAAGYEAFSQGLKEDVEQLRQTQ